MAFDQVRSSKKPSGAKSLQSSIFSSASSRFRKRQVSETGATSQGWSVGDSSSSTTEDHGRVPSRSGTHFTESSTSSSGEDMGSYSSGARVRLVNPEHLSESASIAGSLSTDAAGKGVEVPEPLIKSPMAMSPRSSTPSKLNDHSHTTPPPSRTTTPVPSTSRIHWNQIRNAIMSASSIPPGIPVPKATFPHSAIAPPRPQTPKPSRLARLGFRQVVDQTRELRTETGKFEADIYQACATARFGEVRHKADREGSQTANLPFMSTASLPLSTTTTASQQSRSMLPNELIGRLKPSLKLLHQTLMRYASFSGPHTLMTSLPYESEVLRVLLIPFLVDSGQHVHDERSLAVEAFDIVAQTWPAPSYQVRNTF